MNRTVLYTITGCPTCERARKAFSEGQIPFEERVIDNRPDWQDEVERLSGQYSVPVLVHPDGRVEVGFEGETG